MNGIEIGVYCCYMTLNIVWLLYVICLLDMLLLTFFIERIPQISNIKLGGKKITFFKG